MILIFRIKEKRYKKIKAYANKKLLKSKIISENIKIKLCKIKLKPRIMCEAETDKNKKNKN